MGIGVDAGDGLASALTVADFAFAFGWQLLGPLRGAAFGTGFGRGEARAEKYREMIEALMMTPPTKIESSTEESSRTTK